MPRVLGIDPGTLSVDVCGLDDGRVFLDASIPGSDTDPGAALLDLLDRARPLDLVLGPSGYGLPLLPIEAAGRRELELAFLPAAHGASGSLGLRSLVDRLRTAKIPVVFAPGVIHLPTVPDHRKANRIDLGTADKVCAAALAIHDQARRIGVEPEETAFVLVELGGAFTAILTIDRGRIISGVGGSSGPLGLRSGGALDAELACLLGSVGKEVVFSGGAADLAGGSGMTPEALAARPDAAAERARAALVEGVVKAVAGEMALLGRGVEILLSGRLTRVPGLLVPIRSALGRLGPVRVVERMAERTKEAAQGAALLADGLAGGRARQIVDALRLRAAGGTVLDHLYVAGAADARKRVLGLDAA